jgi:two-component system sensor histidine kinase/response regulator
MSPTDLYRPAVSPPGPEPAEQTGRARILVAEDNDLNRNLIARQLTALGFVAHVAANGQLALDLWRAGNYALLLCDLQMPEMDGYELTAAIRGGEAATTRMPIVAVTASDRRDVMQRCLDSGMDDCLDKPLRLLDLKAALEKWLPAPTGTVTGD